MPQKANPVVWFEIPASDLARAKKFYETLLGAQMSDGNLGPLKMVWFPWTQEGSGATGALVSGPGYTPAKTGTLVYFTVDTVDAGLARAASAGGKTLLPKMNIGEYGVIAHIEDTEGNRIGIHAMT